MSFVWVEGTAVGDIIHKADIDEIHTNIDSVKDSLANITHDDGVLSTHRGTYLLNNYTDHNTDKDFGHFTDHNVSENATRYTSDNGGYNSGYNGTDYSSDYSSYCAAVEVGENKFYHAERTDSDYTGVNNSIYDPNLPDTCTAFNSTVDTYFKNPCSSFNVGDNYYENVDECADVCGPLIPECTHFWPA